MNHSQTTWDAFQSRVLISNGCWYWTGHVNQKGYGLFWVDGRYVRAHRFAYEYLIGDIPSGLTLDHLCRNRRCVNPAHLEPVSRGENVLRGIGISAENKRKTTCKHGHELVGRNLYITKSGHRQCLACHRDYFASERGHEVGKLIARRYRARLRSKRERSSQSSSRKAKASRKVLPASQMSLAHS